jgi:hypothetical protein
VLDIQVRQNVCFHKPDPETKKCKKCTKICAGGFYVLTVNKKMEESRRIYFNQYFELKKKESKCSLIILGTGYLKCVQKNIF